MKQLLRTTMIGALVSLGGLIQAQTTHYVNPDGKCSGNTPCYTTIQSSVNAASTGDVINISAGTFTEDLDIDKDLTLKGSGNGLTNLVSPSLRIASGKDRSVINTDGGAHVLFIGLTVEESSAKLGYPSSGARPLK